MVMYYGGTQIASVQLLAASASHALLVIRGRLLLMNQ